MEGIRPGVLVLTNELLEAEDIGRVGEARAFEEDDANALGIPSIRGLPGIR